MDRPLPTVDVATASLDDAFALLAGGAPALLAVRAGRPVGVVTKLDSSSTWPTAATGLAWG